MSASNKVIWILGLMCAFLLILLTGRTNIRNFEKVQSSIEEIYEDRLVVKGLIFDLSSLLHRKEVAGISQDQAFYVRTNEVVNTQIFEKLSAFRATRLTRDEEATLNRFQKGVERLVQTEKDIGLIQGRNLEQDEIRDFSMLIRRLKEDLDVLSHIQLSEGKRKLLASDEAVESMYTFAQAENYILIVFGILMLVLIFVVPGPKADKVVPGPKGANKIANQGGIQEETPPVQND